MRTTAAGATAVRGSLLFLLAYCNNFGYAEEAEADHVGRWNLRFQNIGFEINPMSMFAKAANMAGGRFNLSVDAGNYISLRAFPGLFNLSVDTGNFVSLRAFPGTKPVSKLQDLFQAAKEEAELPSVEEFLHVLNLKGGKRNLQEGGSGDGSSHSGHRHNHQHNLEAHTRKLNVYAKDQRQNFNWDIYPDRVFGKLAFPSAYYCTGQLIGKRHVLTAAHCFYSYGKQIDGDNMYHSQFRVAYHTTNGQHFYAATSGWGRLWYGTTFPEVYRNSDWAIIELEKPLGETQGYVGINPTDLKNQIPIYNKFQLIGYSEDGYSQTAGKDASCSLEDAYQGVYFHNCDCAAGASGGALLDPSYNVVGINTAHIMPQDKSALRGSDYNPSYPNIAVPANQFMPTFAHILTQMQ